MTVLRKRKWGPTPEPKPPEDGAEVPDHDREKLIEEIKTLRLQRIICVLGLVGAAGAFVIGNAATIRALFASEPKTGLQVTTSDPFIKAAAHVEIKDASQKTIAQYELANKGFVSLPPGSLRVEVSVGSDLIYEGDVDLDKGEQQRITVNDSVLQKIRVSLIGIPSRVQPTEPLLFSIRSSGAGFVWIFRSTTSGACELAFPSHDDGTEVQPEENRIEPPHEFSLPRSMPPQDRMATVTAPETLGAGSLYAVVTSSPDKLLASKIVGHYCDLGVGKAAAGDLRENWGMHKVAFEVR